jgi:hypothetical protein
MNDLRIEHLEALTNPKFTTWNLDLKDIIDFLSVLTSGTVNELKKVNISELKDIYVHCVGLFKDYKVTDPEKEIDVLGQKYELVDPKKIGVGWHIDVSNSDMQTNPARLVALMYIEKGTNYGDLDQNGNMIYSNQEREKIFKQHLPLPIYLNVVSFFLRQSIVLIESYTGSQKRTKLKLIKNLIALRGKR